MASCKIVSLDGLLATGDVNEVLFATQSTLIPNVRVVFAPSGKSASSGRGSF